MQLTFADIAFPVWLVVSQWVLLFGLGFLVITMYRQIALLESLKGGGSDHEGLPVGAPAPSFGYMPVNRDINVTDRFEPKGKWSLLLFADPTCASCKNTLLALERLVPKLESMQILVATTAEPALIAATDEFRLATVEIGRIPADISTRLYHTTITPFAHLIDPEGMIHAKGVATDESSLRKIVRQGDRKPVNVEFIVS